MKKPIVLCFIAAGVCFLYSCRKNLDNNIVNSTVYLDLPTRTAAYYDTSLDNASQVNKLATLGRVLFYDNHLSVNNSVACASCHKQEFAFADNTALSRGFESRLTKRNSPPIQNLGFGGVMTPSNGVFSRGSLFWDARASDTKALVAKPITNHVEMGIDDVDALAEKLAKLPYYKALFTDAFGTDAVTAEKISEAVSTFMCAIPAKNTRFDQYMQGQGTLSALELKGQILFNTTYPCSNCHQAQALGYMGTEIFNIGLDYPNVDKGVGALTGSPTDMGKFRIPSLRNVARTAPYMHDGRFATLEEVLDHYSHGIQNDPNLDQNLRNTKGDPMRMNISDDDKKAIIAFLNTLTDYSTLTDAKYSTPFKTK